MKAAIAILALLISFDAFAVNVAVRATTATGDAQESQALVDLLKVNGAQGYDDGKAFSVTGSIWKTAVNCPNRKFMYTVSLTESRAGRDREGGYELKTVDLPTITAKPCEMNSGPDKIREVLLNWGANRITDATGSIGFSMDCDTTSSLSCFVRLGEGATFGGG